MVLGRAPSDPSDSALAGPHSEVKCSLLQSWSLDPPWFRLSIDKLHHFFGLLLADVNVCMRLEVSSGPSHWPCSRFIWSVRYPHEQQLLSLVCVFLLQWCHDFENVNALHQTKQLSQLNFL